MSDKIMTRTGAVIAMALLGATVSIGSAAAGVTGPADPLGTLPTSTGTLGPSAFGGAITRAQIIARADDWMNQSVMYSTAQDSTGDADYNYWSDSATGGPYRQDCSGFVSMAWGLSSSLATPTLPGVAKVTDANISGDTNLNSGDALDYTADHVVLFDHWTDSSGDFAYDAEHTEGQATNQSTDSIYDSTLEGYAMSDFEALQYDNLTTAAAPTEGDVWDNSLTSGTWAGVKEIDGGGHVTATASVGLPGGTLELFTVSSGDIWENDLSAAGTWSGAREIDANGSIKAISAAALPNGTVHLDSIAPGGVYDDTQSTAGGSWSGGKAVDGNATISKISLAALSNGVLHLETLSSGGVYDNSLSTGGTWAGAKIVDSNSSISQIAAAAVGTTVHLETLSSGGLYDNSLPSGGSWGGAKIVDGNSSITAIAAASPGGVLHLETIANGGVYDDSLSTSGSWVGGKGVDPNPAIFSFSLGALPNGTMYLQTITSTS